MKVMFNNEETDALVNAGVEAGAAFPCCGGSDEYPPEHTQDCHVLVRARNEGLELAAVLLDAERTGGAGCAMVLAHCAANIRAKKKQVP